MTSLVTTGDRIITISGRASSLKRSSVPFSAWAGGGVINLIGEGNTISFAQLYERQPWVKVCVDKLSHQIATLPLKGYEIGSQNERARVIDHPLVNLLQRPWPRARPVQLKQKIAFPALLHGNALLAKRRPRSGAPPTSFKPLDWRFLSWREEAGELLFWETNQGGDSEFIAPAETVHFYWESPNGITGTSPLMPLGVTVALEDAAQQYSTSSFESGVNPAMAITLDANAKYDDETRQGIREGVEAIHGGRGKNGKVMVVGGGASVETLSHTAKEAELIEQRKLNREEVAAVYDIPPPMIGILDKATYSNISEQHKMLYMTVLRPYLTLIEETFEAHLIDGEAAFEGVHLEFDLAEVLKGDAKERAEAFKTFLEAGVYTINELRKMENLPRVDHPLADRPLIPANNLQPLENVQDSDPTGVAPVLASHLSRAADRVTRGNPLNSDRFKRELQEDLEPKLGPGAEPFATVWAQAVEEGVLDANGDKGRTEQFFTALCAD